MSRIRRRKTGRRHPADLTRSPQWRAGTRRNKRTRNVGTLASDRKASR